MSTWIARDNLTGSLACWRVQRMLQSYLDEELEAAAAGRVTRHLEGCHQCGQEAAPYRAITASLRLRRSAPDAAQRLRDFGEALLDDPGKSSRSPRSVRG